MIERHNDQLLFSFPAVHDSATLRISFSPPHSPGDKIQLHGPPDQVQLSANGLFVIQLRPQTLQDETFLYPFAMLISVDGKNAITGKEDPDMSRDPQNYFSSPPQGAIDGYFSNGQVHPFRSTQSPSQPPSHLSITAFPAKKEAIEHWKQLRQMSGYQRQTISGLTLTHGGERQSEPIYEDLCSIGNWEQNLGQEVILRI